MPTKLSQSQIFNPLFRQAYPLPDPVPVDQDPGVNVQLPADLAPRCAPMKKVYMRYVYDPDHPYAGDYTKHYGSTFTDPIGGTKFTWGKEGNGVVPVWAAGWDGAPPIYRGGTLVKRAPVLEYEYSTTEAERLHHANEGCLLAEQYVNTIDVTQLGGYNIPSNIYKRIPWTTNDAGTNIYKRSDFDIYASSSTTNKWLRTSYNYQRDAEPYITGYLWNYSGAAAAAKGDPSKFAYTVISFKDLASNVGYAHVYVNDSDPNWYLVSYALFAPHSLLMISDESYDYGSTVNVLPQLMNFARKIADNPLVIELQYDGIWPYWMMTPWAESTEGFMGSFDFPSTGVRLTYASGDTRTPLNRIRTDQITRVPRFPLDRFSSGAHFIDPQNGG
jgi:hypothetical protein